MARLSMLKALAGALAAAFLAASLPVHAQSPAWIATWGASPIAPAADPARQTPIRFSGQTIRQVVRISAGGRQVRLRFTNEYGAAPLHIGAARVGITDPGDARAVVPGSDRVLTFNGKSEVYIPEGAPMLSDPVDLDVAALASLSVSLYVPDAVDVCTCHRSAYQTAYVSGPFDVTAATSFPVVSTLTTRAFLSGVEVRPVRAGQTIVTFGDSITDGAFSTPDTNRRWPDRLAERLFERDGARLSIGVSNQGVSGNRLLVDNINQNALARFDRDVLSVPGVRHVIVFLGVNDLGVNYGAPTPQRPRPPHPFSGDELIGAYKQLIERAHERGLKIYGVTIAPYEGANYWSPEGEAVRAQVNTWIRTGKAFDAVLDFDAVWRDPAHPSRSRPGMMVPDNLHGTDAGYRALADSVDLSLFR